MDLDLKTLAIFVKVSELRSFVRAAEALDITQAGVSNAIKRLETQLGVALLVRTTRSVNLTGGGEAFFHRCKQIIADLDDAQQVLTRTQKQPTGILRVSLPASFGRTMIVPLLGEFQAQNEKVEIAISITDRYVNLVEEGVDVALRFGALEDSTLISRKLVSVRRRVIATPAYLAKHGTPQTIDDLAQHNCLPLAYHETGRIRQWKFCQDGAPRHFSPRGSMVFNDGHALHTSVGAGFGLGQIHDYYVDADVSAGLLVPVLEQFEPEADEIFIVYPKASHLSPRVRAFVDFLVGVYG